MNRESINQSISQSINQPIKLWKTWMSNKIQIFSLIPHAILEIDTVNGLDRDTRGELGQREIHWLFVPIHPRASQSTLVDSTKSSNDELFFFSLWNPEIWTFFLKIFFKKNSAFPWFREHFSGHRGSSKGRVAGIVTMPVALFLVPFSYRKCLVFSFFYFLITQWAGWKKKNFYILSQSVLWSQDQLLTKISSP